MDTLTNVNSRATPPSKLFIAFSGKLEDKNWIMVKGKIDLFVLALTCHALINISAASNSFRLHES